ncbi:MAG: GGDEF domain-containing protein, partial [Thermodesulfobacteriota bacterium]|nr:GGDEF domain-containing protein [Thermodesulfobacteriota bacterium]
MKTPESLIPEHSLTLTRRDLVDFEPLIAREIASFLPFKAHSLYFPKSFTNHIGALKDLEQGRAVYLAREKKVLLPLMPHGELIGVFVARGVGLKAPKTLPAYLSRLASLCLEKLLLYKAGITDPETGLSRRDHFLDTLAHEIELAQSCMPAGPESCLDAEGPRFSACLGVLLVKIPELEALAERHGRAFGNNILAEAARVVRALCPDKAHAARFFDDSLAVVRPGATSTQIRELADRISGEMSGLRVPDPVLDSEIPVGVAVGTAEYPKDMDGPELFPRPREQAWMLVKKAERAALATWERGPNTAFAFGHILDQGGRVLETLPVNRLMVSLGRSVSAQEGRMFSVLSGNNKDKSCKAEIVLMRVFEHQSLAEVLYQADPSRPILPGDRLTLIQEEESLAQKGEGPGSPNKNAHGLYSYRDFLERWTREREAHKTFTLALVRMPEQEKLEPDQAGEIQNRTKDRIQEASTWAAEIFGENAFGGRFGASGMIFFLPNVRGKKAVTLGRELYRRMAESFEAVPALGLAPFPYLSFTRSDTLENCRKALDYALLLKPPRVGLLDTLALNISADRLFSQDRIFDAIEEYKLALLADRTNTMARN